MCDKNKYKNKNSGNIILIYKVILKTVKFIPEKYKH